MVHHLRAYSNRHDLREDLSRALRNLERAIKAPARERRSVFSAGRMKEPVIWKLQDRLDKEAIKDVIKSFMAGTPKRVLAERYGVSKASIEKVLRQHGVKRKSRGDIRPDDLPPWINSGGG